jgi:nucleotide-binding universal stress UspA family protein
LVEVAAELDADIIVIGTHGRTGLKRILLGSVAEMVVRRAGCPVFVVREKLHTAESD